MSATTDSPRIAPPQPPYEPSVAEQLERWMPPPASGGDAHAEIEPLVLFRTLAVHEELMSRMRPLGAGILGSRATVPIGLRELMIDRTCALTGAEYEWGVHATAFGDAADLDGARLRATALGGSAEPCWDQAQSAVLRLAEELHHTSSISEELWRELSSLFSPPQTIELIVTAGWYHVIAYLCNGLQLAPEPWAARFPRPHATGPDES
jgi:alkylhydroperoxidase family enzyme